MRQLSSSSAEDFNKQDIEASQVAENNSMMNTAKAQVEVVFQRQQSIDESHHQLVVHQGQFQRDVVGIKLELQFGKVDETFSKKSSHATLVPSIIQCKNYGMVQVFVWAKEQDEKQTGITCETESDDNFKFSQDIVKEEPSKSEKEKETEETDVTCANLFQDTSNKAVAGQDANAVINVNFEKVCTYEVNLASVTDELGSEAEKEEDGGGGSSQSEEESKGIETDREDKDWSEDVDSNSDESDVTNMRPRWRNKYRRRSERQKGGLKKTAKAVISPKLEEVEGGGEGSSHGEEESKEKAKEINREDKDWSEDLGSDVESDLTNARQRRRIKYLRKRERQKSGLKKPAKAKIDIVLSQELEEEIEQKTKEFLKTKTLPLWHRPTGKNLSCLQCGDVEFKTKDKLWSHIRLHLGMSAKYPDNFKFCVPCRKYRSNMNNHVQSKHLDMYQPYPCHLCTKRFQTRSLLTTHLRSKHLNSHAGQVFKCKLCEAEYTYKIALDRHVTGKHFSHVCPICGKKTYGGYSHIQRHALVHAKARPYQCEYCGKGFNQKCNLRGHIRTHTGDKPYRCDMCPKAFTHNVSLKTHKKNHHGVDLWKKQ